MRTAKDRGLGNVEIITCDINNLHLNQKYANPWGMTKSPISTVCTLEFCEKTRATLRSRFDRVISIEMFEHMKNYQKLLALVCGM
jgi:cyclopropane fatty-acyl-phospholipid synthase-like methyltransferase